MDNKERKLNVGSGSDIKEGWTNLDMHNTFHPEVIFDLNNIYKGEKLPFYDNTFDYVYCSHVLEDFINPMPIIDEMIRVTKEGGKIEIRTPSPTNIWGGNPYHIHPYSLRIFRGIPDRFYYGEKRNIRTEKLFYYTTDTGNILYKLYKYSFIKLFNFLGYKFVENTPIEYLMRIKDVGVIYRKINQNQENVRNTA